MEISFEQNGRILLLSLSGRMDSFGSQQFQQVLDHQLPEDALCAVVDMTAVDYLSSAGLRVLLKFYKDLKRRGGAMVLSRVQKYCQNVIEMAGFAGSMPVFVSNAPAMAHCERILRDRDCIAQWDRLEQIETDTGKYRVVPGDANPVTIAVLGDVKNVLYSRVDASQLCSKRFSETEYSIGLGGLGDWVEDYMPILGEMITVGGTMVWLPTDGHDTPDFLIPKSDKGQVTLRTVFNVSVSGTFNETFLFESADPAGVTVDALYRDLFELALQRRADYRGAIALAMHAQMASVYGSGIRRSPLTESAPANGEMVVHESNIGEWFDSDAEPRHRDVTALICGIGVDLKFDLSAYNQDTFNRVFYLHPANVGAKTALLHNHAVVFQSMPMPEKAVNLDEDIRTVVEQGEFTDMRHLLDRSAVTRALIGVGYIQDFHDDPHGFRGVEKRD